MQKHEQPLQSGARRATSTQAPERGQLPSLQPHPRFIGLMVVMMAFFSIGAKFIGINLRHFYTGFPIIFTLAVLSYIIANQATLNAIGLSYVLWGLALGLIITNTIGVPQFLKSAGQTEFFIKTGLVLLGASILFGQIALIGIPGIFVTWVVTPIVLV
jgi:hypothetical protein